MLLPIITWPAVARNQNYFGNRALGTLIRRPSIISVAGSLSPEYTRYRTSEIEGLVIGTSSASELRVLVAIPHYVGAPGTPSYSPERTHGALMGEPGERCAALAACLTALHQSFRPVQWLIDHSQCVARNVAATLPHILDVVICTTGGRHVLDELARDGIAAPEHFSHRPTTVAPEMLGFACHEVLRERLGAYDYYCYLEDDLVVHDPWFFAKLSWFNAAAGDDKLLQPNRFEAGLGYLTPKVYLDGALAEQVTAAFQAVRGAGPLIMAALGQRVVFEQTANPHAGCFFLHARQMEHWARQPHFGDRQTWLIGPLETAATLGILRTFAVYKPALVNADFLEVQHHGKGYLKGLCR